MKRQEKQGTEEKGAKRKNEFEILKMMAMKITMGGLQHRVVWQKELCTSFPSKQKNDLKKNQEVPLSLPLYQIKQNYISETKNPCPFSQYLQVING